MNADQQTMNEMAALLKERNALRSQVRELREALREVVDATAGIDQPDQLEGYGIPPERAEEICALAQTKDQS